MDRSRSTVLAGVGAALLCNYWVLEDALARRTDAAASWISDLAARSEAFGWRFEVLEIAAGLGIAAFALLLLARLGSLSPPVRRGILALLAAGALTAIGGAAPLSCAEGLDPRCSLSYDPLDVIHATANVASVLATAVAFALLGIGLAAIPGRRGAGRVTLTIGAVWLAFALVTGLTYPLDGLDSVKGIFQRGEDVVFGAWLALLGAWAAFPAGDNNHLTSDSAEVRGSNPEELLGEDQR